MAGLLAWAADVVAGSSSPEETERLESRKPFLRLTPDQRIYLSTLDARAATLQTSLSDLRHCIPPSSIAQRLPHLHADSLSTHAALAIERHAHATTRTQLEEREATLLSENASYAKALTSIRQHVAEKAQEAVQLEAELQRMEMMQNRLKAELDDLRSENEDDGSPIGSQLVGEEDFPGGSPAKSGDAPPDLINKLRYELDILDSRAAALGKELASLQQSAAKWPSPAQREKDLERRLRILTEQLVTKQAQAETWASERNALELRLERANEALQHLQAGNVDVNSKRNKIGKASHSLTSASALTAGLDEKRPDSSIIAAPVRHRAAKGVASVASSVDALSLQAGRQLRRSTFLRSLTMVYIIGLHLAVFIILSVAGFSK